MRVKLRFDLRQALSLWTDKYLCEKMGQKKVRVEVTPNGYADAIVGNCFVKPEEQLMTMESFFVALHNQAEDSSQGIFYISHQVRLPLDSYHLNIPQRTGTFGRSFWSCLTILRWKLTGYRIEISRKNIMSLGNGSF
jgi:hypothetical protein